MEVKNSVEGIVLAGGKSRRMGTDKGLLMLEGKPMVNYVLDTLLFFTENIKIITSNQAYNQFGFPLLADQIPNCGPLGGIVTGLATAKADYIITLSCDIPYVTPQVIEKLLNEMGNNDAAIAVNEKRAHPLIAIYHKRTLKHFKEQLALKELKLMDALEKIKVKKVEMDEFAAVNFQNLNTPQDLWK